MTGIDCPKCGALYKKDGACFQKHVTNCGKTKEAGVGFIAILNMKPADMAALKEEVDPQHIRFVTGEPDAARITGASDVILYRYEKPDWFTVVNNTVTKNKIHVVNDLDGIIITAKKLTR